MPKQKTNVEVITDIMEYSEFGALAQMFVIDALTKAAKRVAEAPWPEISKAFEGNQMISARAWQGVAKEIQAKLDAAYAKAR